MYVKLFESRQSFNYYIIEHHISIKGIEHDQLVIGNQEKKKINVDENELFHVIDKYFKDKLK
jgi:hypothetical protein